MMEQSPDLQFSQQNHESKDSHMQESNKGGQYGEEGQLDVDFDEYDNG